MKFPAVHPDADCNPGCEQLEKAATLEDHARTADYATAELSGLAPVNGIKLYYAVYNKKGAAPVIQ